MRSKAEIGLWAVALGVSGWLVLSGRAHEPVESGEPLAVPEAPPLKSIDLESVAAAAEAVIAMNPFRLERRPADPDAGAEPDPPDWEEVPVSASSPALRLIGVIGGPPWEAIITGFPGHDRGILVRTGDLIGDLKLTAIGRDSAMVEGVDTTWILTFDSHHQ